MKEEGTQKDIFLKTLTTHLFDKYDGQYTRENTLIIDDSPIKHMLNLKENVLLLPSWSHSDDHVARTVFSWRRSCHICLVFIAPRGGWPSTGPTIRN